MNARTRALRLGARRGWVEFTHSVRSRQDQAYYVVTGAATVGYLYVNRDDRFAGTDLSLPAVSMPSFLAVLVVFGLTFGVAATLVGAREDGTLLRAKAVPNGITGFVTGQLVTNGLGLIPQLLIVIVPSVVLFDGVMANGTKGWLTATWVLALGMAALLPLGLTVGAVVPTTQKLFSWGMLGIVALTAISGIFFPVQNLWGWLQALAQCFPLYWLGLGLRSAFLPDSAGSAELGGSWRKAETVLVLGAWGLAGTVAAPLLLRRVARRQSASQVEAARFAAAQWVR